MRQFKLKAWLKDRMWHFLGTVQEPFYTWLNALANAWILFRHPERVTHPGTLYPDKTFYVIRDLPYSVGLAGWYDRVLGYVLRARKKGWIPIVVHDGDHKVEDVKSARGTWYTYFDAVSSFDPSDVGNFANVVEATMHGVIHKRYRRSVVEERHDVAVSCCLNAGTREFIETRLRTLLNSRKCGVQVGVYFRGTDYRKTENWCPIGHAAVPEYEVFCSEVERTLCQWGVPVAEGQNLFVVTEEQGALEYLLAKYPKMLYVRKPRFKNFRFGVRIPDQTPEGVSHLENNRLYLLDIYALARCDYLIGGVNGGVLMALNINGNQYRGVHIIKTGVN